MGGGQQSAYLKKLVIDCYSWHFDTKTALQYIKLIGGKEISEPYYFKIKRRVLSDDETKLWINEHMRVGFARSHRLQIEELERVKDHLMEAFYQYSVIPVMVRDPEEEGDTPVMIPNPKYDVNKITKLATSIDSINKSLDDLNSGTPLVQEIRRKMEENKQTAHQNHNETKQFAE